MPNVECPNERVGDRAKLHINFMMFDDGIHDNMNRSFDSDHGDKQYRDPLRAVSNQYAAT